MSIQIQIPEGPATQTEQILAVRAYAEANYENGWDTLVECYDSDEISDAILGCKTRWGAIFRMKKILGIQNAYAAEIQAS